MLTPVCLSLCWASFSRADEHGTPKTGGRLSDSLHGCGFTIFVPGFDCESDDGRGALLCGFANSNMANICFLKMTVASPCFKVR